MSVGAPRGLASSGQKLITEILHPLSATEEPLSPGPDVTINAEKEKQEPGLTNGTPVEISSPASASVLLNRLQLDEDPEADSQDPYGSTEPCDLFVTVDDPKKHVSTMETYITYRVSTKWVGGVSGDTMVFHLAKAIKWELYTMARQECIGFICPKMVF
ncbi:Sorting nexin-30 [Ataeniobius toweri]|uniref:Sorting nexin-30 n=2 Tax=Goodeidae TaxID=28758 RepID=A0ABU7BRS3_9TELE|nr:Sorting nexin-30 [Ataeniobius toweri]